MMEALDDQTTTNELAARGRDYYLTPAYPMLLAAGAVWGEHWLASLKPRAQAAILRSTWISLLIGGLITVSLVIPVAPVNSTWWRIADSTNGNFNMEIGWPELAATVAQVRNSLSTVDRTHLGILAGDEGEEGAINLYGPAYRLPSAISGMNSNWLLGYGDPPPQKVIMVGMDPDFIERNFVSCTQVAQLSNQYGIENETIGKYSGVYVCGPPVKGWPGFWKDFQYYG